MEAGGASSSGCGAKGKGALVRALLEIQIGVVELSDRLQPGEIQDRHAAVLDLDQPHPPQLLQRAIDVDGSQAEAFGKFDLGKREVVAVVLGETDDPQTDVQLAEQMRHPCDGG